jgi:hypothetical protein
MARVLAIIVVDATMFVGVVGVLFDVASYAPSRPPHQMFGTFSACGILLFIGGLFGRISLSLPKDN